MSRILVVGGYGGFGGRLSRRLAAAGHDVLVAGRSAAKAQAFCVNSPRCRAVVLDRTHDAHGVLRRERPAILIDAAGPFQGSGYGLAEACITAGIHYLDLADSRDFVAGIDALDEQARRAGVAVIAGASSVPALSQAIVESLARGLDRMPSVEIAISASSRASAGDSVAVAILGGVGRPVVRWQGGRWTRVAGWRSMRAERFSLPSGKTLGRRLVAFADVPDLALLPERLAGVSAVSFRAGPESRLANLGLWAASWLVRGGLVRSLVPAARLLTLLHGLTAWWGSDRSGMLVRLFGFDGARHVERRWTLIAERGDGPEIPTLAVALLAERIARGEAAPGARDAGGLLALSDFEPAFTGLAVEHAAIEIEQPPPLYARVMGGDFAKLDPAIRALHSVLRDDGASGRGTVDCGNGWICKAIARMMRFPPAGEYPVHVHFAERGGVEHWTRDFGGYRFSSRLRDGGRGRVIEAFGPLRFHFRLPVRDGGLTMKLERWSLGPLPLPIALAPRSAAREWEEDETFHFDVPISLPLIGRIVHYRGWLRPQNGTSSSRSVSNAAGLGRD